MNTSSRLSGTFPVSITGKLILEDEDTGKQSVIIFEPANDHKSTKENGGKENGKDYS